VGRFDPGNGAWDMGSPVLNQGSRLHRRTTHETRAHDGGGGRVRPGSGHCGSGLSSDCFPASPLPANPAPPPAGVPARTAATVVRQAGTAG